MTSFQFRLQFYTRLAAVFPERSVIAKNRRTPHQLRNADQPAGRRLLLSQLTIADILMSQILSQKQSTLKVIHLLILPKPLVFLLGSIMPLFAQNLSTPLLMTFPRFLTLSSSTEDVSTFSKPFAVTPLKLFTLYTIKISKPSIKKQSIPPIYCEA